MLSYRCLCCLSVCDVGVLWPNGWMDQDKTWRGGRLGPGHSVLDGDPAPPQKRTQPLQFSAHVRSGQTAGWIKMPLDTKVGLGPGDRHCVRWGSNALPPKRGHSPRFSAHVRCRQTAGWIKMPLGTEVGLGPGDIVLDGDQAPPPPKKGAQLPQFRPMSIVAKRSLISATAELMLFYFRRGSMLK